MNFRQVLFHTCDAMRWRCDDRHAMAGHSACSVWATFSCVDRGSQSMSAVDSLQLTEYSRHLDHTVDNLDAQKVS